MNCLTFDQMMRYLDEELTTEEAAQIEEHLLGCPACRTELDRYRGDFMLLDQIGEAGVIAPPLNESFTLNVMAGISARVREAEKPVRNAAWRASRWQKAAIAAACLAIAIALGAYVSPTFADGLKSLFQWVQRDAGAKQAAKTGFAAPVYLTAEDQGIAVTVKEVLADPFRISVMYGVQRDGRTIPAESIEDGFLAPKGERNEVEVTDMSGNKIPFDFKTSRTGADSFFELFLLDPLQDGQFRSLSEIPDQVVFHMTLLKIDETKGSWSLSVPIDLRKAKSVSRSVAINRSYTTPEGVAIDVKQLRLGPSAAELYMDITETEAWSRRTAERFPAKRDMRAKYHQLYYRIKNDRGQVVAAWDGPSLKMLRLDGVNNYEKGIQIGANSMYRHVFLPFTDSKRLTLELKGLYTKEPANVSISVEPQRLLQGPVSTAYEGKTIAVNRVRIKSDPSAEIIPLANTTATIEGPGVFIELESRLGPDVINFGPWRVVDGGGHELQSDDYVHLQKDEQGNYHSRTWIFVRGLQSIPERLELSCDTLEQRIPLHWEVPIDLNAR
ncbi:DUF4179 domain-containing protein [Paenibacillus sp. H1-7]|uniref:DUF4179 domain-containing protein n=1 Tax=Paenibacillus sp. H1-7 TaxID=2282849 RepID=UPI001EF8B747|nr:DUF4179 domain-containing protein [Paenibacillus sp. H1-7]